MALSRVAIPSPNYSSRGGTAVRLVVIHTAEGSLTIESLGSWFQNPASGVSSHTGCDDKVNTVGEYVPPGYKAWTQGNANPYSVATELCAFAAWDAGQWAAHPQMVENCRLWINEECARFGIPRRRLSAHEAQSGVAGVCDHAALGASGGGHWDVGSSFPWHLALGGAAPAAPQPESEENMICTDELTGGQWVAYPDGAVHTVGPAPWLGGTNNDTSGAKGKPCIGIAPYADGYVLVHEFGSGAPGSRDPRSYHFTR